MSGTEKDRSTPPHMRDEDEQTDHGITSQQSTSAGEKGGADQGGKKQEKVGEAVKGALQSYLQSRGNDKPKPSVGEVDIHPDIGKLQALSCGRF